MKRNSATKIVKKSVTPSSNGVLGSFTSIINKNFNTIIKAVGVAAVAIFVYFIWIKSNSVIKNLVNADMEVLKNAIFGDLPYMFYCDKGGKVPDRIPGIFSDLHSIKGSKMGFATINCSQILPSGKTIYDRFKLKKEWRPTIFGTAPWLKPKQANPTNMKDLASLKKFVETSLSPKGTEIASDKELNKFCGFNKKIVKDADLVTDTCIVLLRGSKYSKAQSDLEQKLVLQFPKLKIASIDASKKRLSFEDLEEFPYDNFALRVHALRNGSHYLSMLYPATFDYTNTFVTHAISRPLDEFLTPDNGGKIQLLKPNVKKTKTPKVKPQTKTPPPPPPSDNKDDNKDTTQDKQKEQQDEELTKAERIRKEKLRREEMERQEREHLFHAGDDNNNNNKDDEEDEDLIEL